MSGVSGSNRIQRKDFMQVLRRYEKEVLRNIEGYVRVETSGSFNSDLSKMDFGDMDLIVLFDTVEDKKSLKKRLVENFKKLSDDLIIPFESEKYRGKKCYNSGELVTVSFPQPNGSVQIDNIIALSEEELQFKKSFLDLPAEKQGVILGLTKIAVQENGMELLSSLNIEKPQVSEKEEIEFSLSSTELQLRVVSKENKERKIVWRTKEWDTVLQILRGYNLDTSFEDLVSQAESTIKTDRGLKRVVGVFKSMVSVKSGEVGTPKGENKIKALKRIEKLLDN